MPLSQSQREYLESLTQGAPPTPGTIPPGVVPAGAMQPPPRSPAGLEMQGVTLGKTPNVRLGVPKEPSSGESERRDFARFRTFEGLYSIMEDLAQDVPQGPIKGRYSKYASLATGGGKAPGLDATYADKANNYTQLRPAVAAGFYRAITGDDRISDRDAAERALPFVPDLSLSPETFRHRMGIVKTAIQLRKRAQLEGFQGDDKFFYDIVRQASQSSNKPPSGSSAQQPSDNLIHKGGRAYRIIGYDPDGEPRVVPVP